MRGGMMRDIQLQLVVVCALGCGCGPVAPGDAEVGAGSTTDGSSSSSSSSGVPTTGGGSTSGSTGGSSGVLEPGTGSSSSEAGTSTGGSETGVDFLVGFDGGTVETCSSFAQDCPAGEKCAAYADDGGTSWNNNKCVPVMEDPAQAGEPCFVVGNGVSGIDSCDKGAMCWDTDVEGKGVCVALCTGTFEAPMCPPGADCVLTSQAILNLCFDACDPLIQDCPMDDDLCIPSDQTFVCVLDASGDEGQVHDPCNFANSCDKGLYCIAPENAEECDQDADGCCQPFCDLSMMSPCTGQGQACVAWFEEGTAPEGYEDVGICAVPA
jgi:hypothetical protein